MPTHMRDWQKAAEIVRDAGGRIVGRTKLQKIAYLLELSGLALRKWRAIPYEG
jgi:hypothetical protein